jgi:HD superfamily phosphohydrolase YqeK
MPIYRDSANQIQYGVAGPGANPEKTCSLENMQVKARFPQKHGRDVKDEHLAFSNIVIPTGQQHVLAPVIDEGATIVAVQTMAQPGTNMALVAGTVPSVGDPDGGIPGNSPLDFVFKARYKGAGTKTTPNSKREGEVFKIVEKGIEHSLSLLNHLPTHGANMQIAGMKHDAMKSVSTAKEQFNKVLNSSMLSKLPGAGFSMSNLLSSMTDAQKSEMFKGMDRKVVGAIQSATTLMQSSTSSDSGGFYTADRVNPEVFFQNAVDQMKGSKTVEDVMNAFQSLEGDDLRGMDQLANVAIEIEGTFGNVVQQMDSSGNINIEIPDGVQKIIQAFQSQMGSLPGAGGQSGGMFNNSELKKMFDRLPLDEAKAFKDMIQKNVDSGGAPRSRLNSVLQKALPNKTFPFI